MLQFVHLPLPLRFGHGPLARPPCGLDAVPPWARAGPGTHHDATAACPRFPRRLGVLRHARTAWLTCHAALAHTLHRAVFPAAAPRAVSHASHGVVTARTGHPSTKRRRRPCGSARRRPYHATAWGSGACRAGSCCSKRRGVAAVQACRWGWARRLPHPAAWHPTTPSGGPNASASKRSRHVFCARRGERGACARVAPAAPGSSAVGAPGGGLPPAADAPSRPARSLRQPPGPGATPPGAAQRDAAREAGEAGAGHRGWGPASARRAWAGSMASSSTPARAPATPSSRGAPCGHHRPPAAPGAWETTHGHAPACSGPGGHSRRPRPGVRLPTAGVPHRSRDGPSATVS